MGPWRLCARCTGLYPALLLTFGALAAARSPLSWTGDLLWVLALTAPALVDWSVGVFAPAWGARWLRSATGALLGVALGRSLYVHVQRPWPQMLVAQGLAVAAVALPVLLVRRSVSASP